MGAQENQSTTQETVVNGAAPSSDVAAADLKNNNNNNTGIGNSSNYKGNEDRKIFVGGIAYDVTNDDLIGYFSKFGDVTQAQVKFDRETGRSRGFAFVEFATCEACKNALCEREQSIKNKQCEIKPAKSRENKKVFVGGLPADHSEEELRKHFEQYGKVEDIEWPFDKQTKARRNFAFIVFEEEDAADRASSIAKQTFGARECDVKKAVPQNKRNKNNFLSRGGGGGGVADLRSMYGAAGLRGAPALALHNAATQNAQWFGNGWPQMNGMPAAAAAYAAAAGTAAGTTANWSDWYGNAASAANFYATSGQSPAANFGSAYATNGYDFGQSAGGGVPSANTGMGGPNSGGNAGGARTPHQNGAGGNGPRY